MEQEIPKEILEMASYLGYTFSKSIISNVETAEDLKQDLIVLYLEKLPENKIRSKGGWYMTFKNYLINKIFKNKIKIQKDKKQMSNIEVPEDKASWVLDQWISTLQLVKLSQRDLILVISNLLYSVGASIEGYDGMGPSVSEVLKKYYSDPGQIGIALMAQGLQMNQEWIASLEKITEENSNIKS
jgi:hypothetical protein